MVADSPVVSVVMNCYNSAQYLAQAIDSVYAQTFKDWEIVFFDNCSTDESAAIAHRYTDGRLKYFRSEKTVPLGHARNLAIAKTRGVYVAFLDCDDYWDQQKLLKQIKLMQADVRLGAVFSDALFFGEGVKSFRTFPVIKPHQGMIFRDLLKRYVLPMPTIIVRRDVLNNIGGVFDERFNMVEDADLFLRLAYYYPIAYVDEVLAYRRKHNGSWTMQKKELFPYEEEILLAKLHALSTTFAFDYAEEIAYMKAMIQYQYAILDWEKAQGKKARSRMAPYLPVLKKMWVPFLLSFFPIILYQNLKKFYKMLLSPFKGSLDDQVF